MPANFPLGVSADDRIVFNAVTSMWERGAAAAGGTRDTFFNHFYIPLSGAAFEAEFTLCFGVQSNTANAPTGGIGVPPTLPSAPAGRYETDGAGAFTGGAPAGPPYFRGPVCRAGQLKCLRAFVEITGEGGPPPSTATVTTTVVVLSPGDKTIYTFGPTLVSLSGWEIDFTAGAGPVVFFKGDRISIAVSGLDSVTGQTTAQFQAETHWEHS